MYTRPERYVIYENASKWHNGRQTTVTDKIYTKQMAEFALKSTFVHEKYESACVTRFVYIIRLRKRTFTMVSRNE